MITKHHDSLITIVQSVEKLKLQLMEEMVNNDNTEVEILTWFVTIRTIEGRVSEGDTMITILTKFVNNLQLKKN